MIICCSTERWALTSKKIRGRRQPVRTEQHQASGACRCRPPGIYRGRGARHQNEYVQREHVFARRRPRNGAAHHRCGLRVRAGSGGGRYAGLCQHGLHPPRRPEALRQRAAAGHRLFSRTAWIAFCLRPLPIPSVLVRAARYVKERCPDAYVICECTVAPDGYTQSGISAQGAIDMMKDVYAIDAYGFNCTCGPMHMAHIAKRRISTDGRSLSCRMRAILRWREAAPYSKARRLISRASCGKAGRRARILGGCCGTTLRIYARQRALAQADHTPAAAGAKAKVHITCGEEAPRTFRASQWRWNLIPPLDADGTFLWKRHRKSKRREQTISQWPTVRSGAPVRTAVCSPLC